MSKYQALKDALKAVPAIAEWASEELGVWMSDDPFDTFVCAAEDAREADYIAAANPATISALLADLEAAENALKASRAYIARYGYTGEQLAIIDAALSQLKGD